MSTLRVLVLIGVLTALIGTVSGCGGSPTTDAKRDPTEPKKSDPPERI